MSKACKDQSYPRNHPPMEKIIINDLPKEGHIQVYKITHCVTLGDHVDCDVLGILRVYQDQYIWVRDLFARKKIGRETAINYYLNNI